MSNYRIIATGTEAPAADPERLASMFKGLANPHRLALYRRLSDCCPPGTACAMDEEEATRCVGDLAEGVGIAPSTVSHHLKELAAAGLIRMERRGRHIYCAVEPEPRALLGRFFGGS